MAPSASRNRLKASNPSILCLDKMKLDSRASRIQGDKPELLPNWQKNFIIGIDDCICVAKKTKSRFSARDVSKAVVVSGAKEWVNRRYEEGHNICFFTTRGERLRAATESWLAKEGFKYHSLIMNKPVALQYHYIDDRHVQATTFRGKFAPLVKKEHTIQVFG